MSQQGFVLKSPYYASLPPLTFFPLQPNDIPDDYPPPPPPTLERQTNHDKVGLDDDGYLGDEEDASEDASEDDEIKTKYHKLRRSDSMFVDGLKRTETAFDDGIEPPYPKLRRTDSTFVDGLNPTGIEDSW
jgi:hypothetical protein